MIKFLYFYPKLLYVLYLYNYIIVFASGPVIFVMGLIKANYSPAVSRLSFNSHHIFIFAFQLFANQILIWLEN